MLTIPAPRANGARAAQAAPDRSMSLLVKLATKTRTAAKGGTNG